jgi:hypothetical protein
VLKSEIAGLFGVVISLFFTALHRTRGRLKKLVGFGRIYSDLVAWMLWLEGKARTGKKTSNIEL